MQRRASDQAASENQIKGAWQFGLAHSKSIERGCGFEVQFAASAKAASGSSSTGHDVSAAHFALQLGLPHGHAPYDDGHALAEAELGVSAGLD